MKRNRTRDARALVRVPQFAIKPATMPFEGVDVRPGETDYCRAQPMRPFRPTWLVTYNPSPFLYVSDIYIGNVCVWESAFGVIPAMNWCLDSHLTTLRLFLAAHGATDVGQLSTEQLLYTTFRAAKDAPMFAPFMLGAPACEVGNIITVRVENRGPDVARFECAMFGESKVNLSYVSAAGLDHLDQVYGDDDIDDTEPPTPEEVDRFRNASPPTVPSPAPAAPVAEKKDAAPDSDSGAWASPQWEEP
jgi:hypothetical protein